MICDVNTVNVKSKFLERTVERDLESVNHVSEVDLVEMTGGSS